MADTATPANARPVWWAPKLERAVLKGLMQRSDAHGLAFLAGWAVLLALCGAAIHFSFGSLWVVPAVVAYGFVLGFAYAPSHEAAHGTAFRTRWLNEAVFWLTSVIWGESPVHRRYAHAHHHTHTWHWPVDAQMGYHNPVSLKTWVGDVLGFVELLPRLKFTFRHAFGRIRDKERRYMPEAEVPKLVSQARILLAIYFGLAAWAVIGQTLVPLLYFFIPRIVGAWGVFLFITTQHMAMNQNVYDHRESTRSMTNNGLFRLLYWNMNYHIEHHLYPTVPFHALPALNAAIRDQLPAPSPSLLAAHVEIVRTILAQRRDPTEYVRRELPAARGAATAG